MDIEMFFSRLLEYTYMNECECVRCRIPPRTSPELRDLLLRMLKRNAKERIEFGDLFSHPFITHGPHSANSANNTSNTNNTNNTNCTNGAGGTGASFALAATGASHMAMAGIGTGAPGGKSVPIAIPLPLQAHPPGVPEQPGAKTPNGGAQGRDVSPGPKFGGTPGSARELRYLQQRPSVLEKLKLSLLPMHISHADISFLSSFSFSITSYMYSFAKDLQNEINEHRAVCRRLQLAEFDN